MKKHHGSISLAEYLNARRQRLERRLFLEDLLRSTCLLLLLVVAAVAFIVIIQLAARTFVYESNHGRAAISREE